jgi:hypothetical protein
LSCQRPDLLISQLKISVKRIKKPLAKAKGVEFIFSPLFPLLDTFRSIFCFDDFFFWIF